MWKTGWCLIRARQATFHLIFIFDDPDESSADEGVCCCGGGVHCEVAATKGPC
jgi:hypothetical protein